MARLGHAIYKNAIEALSKEEFDEFVRIFETSYLGAEDVVLVDGANDGGTDLKLFRGRRELNKCVQLTVQKDNLDNKVTRDLAKMAARIEQGEYSTTAEYFFSKSLSEGKVEEYKRKARTDYGITLEVYEAKRLSQLDCPEAHDYLRRLLKYDDKKKVCPVDKTMRVLYDVLAGGNDAMDIKNAFLHSIIVCSIYEHGGVSIQDLKREVEKRTGKEIPDFVTTINHLKARRRIKGDAADKSILLLTDEEAKKVRDSYNQSELLENEFYNSFDAVLNKHGIASHDQLLRKLKDLYNTNYQWDINETTERAVNFENRGERVFQEFREIIQKGTKDVSVTSDVIQEIKQLCASNGYINRITASATFLSLYKSDHLQDYISRKRKRVFLDTPVFIYILCAGYFQEEDRTLWPDLYYRASLSLSEFQEHRPDVVQMCVLKDYLEEAAGEVQKALRMAWFEGGVDLAQFGDTRNTFVNIYQFLKANKAFYEEDKIEALPDFIATFGISDTDVDSPAFLRRVERDLYNECERLGIEIVAQPHCAEFAPVKKEYETQLDIMGRRKSEKAIVSDVNQILYAADKNNAFDPGTGEQIESYFATWDQSLYQIRKWTADQFFLNYGFFYIQNPSKLVNKFSLENFDIDNASISSDVFMYAENEFQIYSKVRNLMELLIPIMCRKGNRNTVLAGKLNQIREAQRDERQQEAAFAPQNQGDALPIENIFACIIEHTRSPKPKFTLDDLAVLFADEENNRLIVECIKEASAQMKAGGDYEPQLLQWISALQNVEVLPAKDAPPFT